MEEGGTVSVELAEETQFLNLPPVLIQPKRRKKTQG
jgi:hypothetical protein